jgi:hypothetical protein
MVNIEGVKSKPSSTQKNEPEKPGNYIDTFVKRMFGRVLVFIDFLKHYADKGFVAEINVKKVKLAPTHYIGQKGDERIIDLVFQCPLKSGDGSLMAVIIFEHESKNLNEIPLKLLKYIAAIWDAERKEGKKILSTPYFIVLRTGKKPHKGAYPTIANSLPKGNDGKPLGHVPEIRYDVVDLPTWDFDKLIGGTVLRLALGMLHKMTGGNLDEYPVVLQLLSEITDEKQQIELSKELWDFVDKAFKANNRRLDAAKVREVITTIFPGKEQTMIKSCFDELRDEGIAIGEERSEIKWKADMLLKVLRGKFNKVPKEVEKAIRQMTDPIALESWAIHAATCQSMDEFAEALK